MFPGVMLLLTFTLLVEAASDGDPQGAAAASHILKMSGIHGGIAVHLGCGQGRLTAALGANGQFTVHGLDADPAFVATARRHLRQRKLQGPVSVEHFAGPQLPYVDNLINLLVVQDIDLAPEKEWMRVLAPGGVVCTQRNGQWEKTVKPWPDNIDEWTHFLHDANNNAVAQDALVGPPRHLQWIAPPLWLRSHETPSGIQSPVSAAGRLFYFFDEGLIGITDERLPDRWSLICRDAFNGRLLWKRPLEAWGWREWSRTRYQGKDWTTLRAARTDVPNENQRRIVACGSRLYTTLAYRAPLSILDARTGDTLVTVPETEGASEILVSDGIALAYIHDNAQARARRRGAPAAEDAALVAVDAQTGKVLWQRRTTPIRPLALAIDRGRILFLSEKQLVGLDLKSGEELWRVTSNQANPRTLLAENDVLVMQGGKLVTAYDATDGGLLWEKTVPPIGGGEGDDLFVVEGLVWRGMLSVNDQGQPVGKSPHALVLGWDLRSGQEKRRILVNNLRSPEHHHRCYRNKATTRYLISSYEGAEFLDFQADNHSQNNWLRGACRNGMMPCNGLLYVPSDQCFCQPGSKLLGYAAVSAGLETPRETVPDDQRLEKGPAYGTPLDTEPPSGKDWPMHRHDPGRRASTTAAVAPDLVIRWKLPLSGKLTAPVVASGRLLVAQPDAHTVHAIDSANGKPLWQFSAQGRVDSPPTLHRGYVLFGSSDGRVYCLRASDGQLVWRFLAAPSDRRVAAFDQIESAWPVHGSVLVEEDILYCTAGRSTYLDGGIRLYGLDPATGKILHRGILAGPHPDTPNTRDAAFYLLGANSDLLVSEDAFLYMRQKKLSPDLKEIPVPVLSSKGAQHVGRHIFSTSGLLDDSWYNRTFWMYSKRWPGFQLANQAPKTGQLLVVDEQKTFAVRVFYRRNVHSPMFFPGREGYLLFADWNTTEPQIVGEEGSRPPLQWLPQSDFSRARGNEMRSLESKAFGLDKMIGYTRAEPPIWTCWLPVRIRAMVKAGDTLFLAGPPDLLDETDPFAAFEDRKGARLLAVSAQEGQTLSETELESSPVFDGLIAADGRLFASLCNGSVVCLAGR